MKTRKGIIDPITLTVVAVLAISIGIFGAKWHPFAFLKKKPPTVELKQEQADLDKLRADLVATQDKERADLEAQVRAAQQMQAGAALALGRIPTEHVTAESKLAGNLLIRSDLRLVAAIGKLPEDQQAEILSIIDQALSGKQEEIDAANKKLADKDGAIKLVSEERDSLKNQIPVLKSQVTEKDTLVKATQTKVIEYADKADAKERESGSLSASLASVFHWLEFAGIAYVLIFWLGPGILKHMEDDWPKRALRNVCGYLSSPLLYHDARKKLSDLADQLIPPKP
jgi:hypothetical protein